jgi:hypothetical protein
MSAQSKPIQASPPPVNGIDVEKIPRCKVLMLPNGGMQVSVLVDPDITKRYMTRANGMPLYRYLYEQVLQRAIVDHVF